MLGLNSVSLPFIQDNLSKLPVLASLLQSGTLCKLRSPAAYFSDSVWPTFASGKTPGEHGQYFPFQWVAEHREYRRIADPRWSEELDVEPFWHRVARAGVPAIAFDVAHTLHDERAPCLQITNWSYQSSGNAKASQPEVLNDLRRRFGHRPIGREVPVPKTARQCDAIRDRLIAAVRAKADATLYLMNRPWNLFVTGWFEAHRAGHNLWPVEGDFASDSPPTRCSPFTRKPTSSWAAFGDIGKAGSGHRAVPVRAAWNGAEPGAEPFSHGDTVAAERSLSRPGSQWVEEARRAQRDSLSPACSAARPAISGCQHTRRTRSGLGREPRVRRRRRLERNSIFPAAKRRRRPGAAEHQGPRDARFLRDRKRRAEPLCRLAESAVVGDRSCRDRRAVDQADRRCRRRASRPAAALPSRPDPRMGAGCAGPPHPFAGHRRNRSLSRPAGEAITTPPHS